PVAVDDSNSGNEGNETIPSTPITGNVLSNDTDVDTPNVDFVVTSTGVFATIYGTVTFNADGSYSYVIDDANPAVNALNVGDSLVDSIAYTMSDGNLSDPKTSSANLLILLDALPNSPVAVDDSNSGNEGNETI